MLLKPGELTSGLIKSNNPKLPITPPGLAAASFNSCAAFAISKICPAIFSNPTDAGPIPIIHLFVFAPKSAAGISQSSKILAIPNIPSALSLNIPSISPSNMLETPFNTSPNTLLIPLMTSLKIAPINWSPIQSVKFSTLSVNCVSKLKTSPDNLSVIFLTTQGKAFWTFSTFGISATCAAVAAFFARAILPVAPNTVPYSFL